MTQSAEKKMPSKSQSLAKATSNPKRAGAQSQASSAKPKGASKATASQAKAAPIAKSSQKNKKPSPLLNRPGFLIRRLHQIHSALFSEEVVDSQITPVQYSLLSTLYEHGVLDQNSLAHLIGLERTSVAEVLPRLEDRGLIARHRSETDGRIRLVKLTEEGADLFETMLPAVLRAHARTIEALPAHERKELIRMLALLVNAEASEKVPPLRQR